MKIVEAKKDMDARFVEVGARFAQVDARFAQVDARFDTLEARIAAAKMTTCRGMDILFEQFKAENRLALDKLMATDQRVASVEASNAGEHTTIVGALQDHEVRIKALETPHMSPEAPHSST